MKRKRKLLIVLALILPLAAVSWSDELTHQVFLANGASPEDSTFAWFTNDAEVSIYSVGGTTTFKLVTRDRFGGGRTTQTIKVGDGLSYLFTKVRLDSATVDRPGTTVEAAITIK